MNQQERVDFLLRHYTLEFSMRVAETRMMVAIADNTKEVFQYWEGVLEMLKIKYSE